ncbi:MAG: hypothetical protein ABW141_02360 [Candidatus Thiodiazotropha endolucinida]
MTISLGMLSGLGNTASAVERTLPGAQAASPDKHASGGPLQTQPPPLPPVTAPHKDQSARAGRVAG